MYDYIGVVKHRHSQFGGWHQFCRRLYANGAVLSQFVNNKWQPVIFHSQSLNEVECNYEIYDKELLATIYYFKKWRLELEGADFLIKVIIDYKNLEYFMITKLFSCKQARWSEFLSRFDFKIT